MIVNLEKQEVTDVENLAEIVDFDEKYLFKRKWLKEQNGVYKIDLYKIYRAHDTNGNKSYFVPLKHKIRYLDIDEVSAYLRNKQQDLHTLELGGNDLLLRVDKDTDRFVIMRHDHAIDPEGEYYVIRYNDDDTYDVLIVDTLLLKPILYLESQQEQIDVFETSASATINRWHEKSRQLFRDLWR